VARSDELVEELLGSQTAPGLETGPGIAGITRGLGGRSWDAFGSAHAPAVVGDRIAFVTLGDGTVLVEDEQPEGALGPLADVVDYSLVGGSRDVQIDGVPADGEVAGLDAIADGRGDVALHAERVDGDVFAVDVFPL